MSKHTPGPWIHDTNAKGGGVVYNGTVGTIATVDDEMAAWRENLALLAAAPDLLTALRGLLSHHGCDPNPGQACEHVMAAETAIAKAEGR